MATPSPSSLSTRPRPIFPAPLVNENLAIDDPWRAEANIAAAAPVPSVWVATVVAVEHEVVAGTPLEHVYRGSVHPEVGGSDQLFAEWHANGRRCDQQRRIWSAVQAVFSRPS